jgi:hypothetical protein
MLVSAVLPIVLIFLFLRLRACFVGPLRSGANAGCTSLRPPDRFWAPVPLWSVE